MKKVIAAIGIIFALNVLVSADVILPNTHPVQCCTKISNANSFPDIVVIGYIHMVSGGSDRYVINQDSCLTYGYKFNSFYLLWTVKSYFDSVGLANLPLDDFINGLGKKKTAVLDSRIRLLSNSIDLYVPPVPDTNKLISEELRYLLYGNGSNIVVHLSEKRSTFSDNTMSILIIDWIPPDGVKPSTGAAVRYNTIENVFIRNGIFTFKTEFTGRLDILVCDCKGQTLVKQQKLCVPGCTYVSDFAGLKSGLYWMRLKSPNVETTKQLTIMR
jgi:hypothetical protein